MCCSTGICGPSVDPVLPQFAGFLAQLKSRGVTVERYNLAQAPMAFVQNAAVKSFLETEGAEKLPVIFIDGELALSGGYPDHDKRAEWIRRFVGDDAVLNEPIALRPKSGEAAPRIDFGVTTKTDGRC